MTCDKTVQLGPVTLDNASPNLTMCREVKVFHIRFKLPVWDDAENQLM